MFLKTGTVDEALRYFEEGLNDMDEMLFEKNCSEDLAEELREQMKYFSVAIIALMRLKKFVEAKEAEDEARSTSDEGAEDTACRVGTQVCRLACGKGHSNRDGSGTQVQRQDEENDQEGVKICT